MNPPPIKGFRPYGRESGRRHTESIFLHIEEYEALKLCDYDGLNHNEASEIMHISRPTFTRIYAEARRKIANSLVEGRQVVIEGGKIFYDSDWFKCKSCGCDFNNPDKGKKPEACPLCGSSEVIEAEDN